MRKAKSSRFKDSCDEETALRNAQRSSVTRCLYWIVDVSRAWHRSAVAWRIWLWLRLRLYSSLKMAVSVNFRIMQVSRTPSHRPTSVRKICAEGAAQSVVSTANPFQWQLEEGIRVKYSRRAWERNI